MDKRSVVLALVAALLGSTAAQAVTTVVNAVLDRPYTFPGPSDRNPGYYTQYLPAFAFDPGDTLDVTLTFVGGAQLNLGFLPSIVQFTVFGGTGATGTVYQSTATFSFINPAGAVNETTGPRTGVFDRNPAVAFTGVRQRQRGPLAFDGMRVVIHLDSAVLPYGPPGPVPPATFSAFSVRFTNDVPEPAVWTMLIMGFGLTGATERRRRIQYLAHQQP
ncbi:PEPxxWA-CTERM sorting domain-containing protein [Sandarakinorhabdus sp.]|uniref:PEPxxWA-CTERM sorting domain-containing protein n=1 Tax=Sandarakinorhabdus sp. TaxID=1916663 RepID=UPI00286E37FA|nr:PEPxxWA-CTERM sorting domain-containing protein [Sandarakinorhabdus sp.]